MTRLHLETLWIMRGIQELLLQTHPKDGGIARIPRGKLADRRISFAVGLISANELLHSEKQLTMQATLVRRPRIVFVCRSRRPSEIVRRDLQYSTYSILHKHKHDRGRSYLHVILEYEHHFVIGLRRPGEEPLRCKSVVHSPSRHTSQRKGDLNDKILIERGLYRITSLSQKAKRRSRRPRTPPPPPLRPGPSIHQTKSRVVY